MARVLIVDGYNLLRSSPRYRAIAEERDVDAARAALVNDVAGHVAGDAEAIVVFDGGGNRASTGEPHDAGGATVVFSPWGSDADEVIESLTAARVREGHEVSVATSDAETQWVSLGLGATRVSAAELDRKLAEDRESLPDSSRGGSVRVALDAHVDEETRARLARWARGEAADG